MEEIVQRADVRGLWVIALYVVQCAKREHSEGDGHEVFRKLDLKTREARDGASGIVESIGCFGGKTPWGFVPGAGVDSAEEKGVESTRFSMDPNKFRIVLLDFYRVRGEHITVAEDLEERDVAV